MKILKTMKNERVLCFCAKRFTAVAAVLYIFTPTHSSPGLPRRPLVPSILPFSNNFCIDLALIAYPK